jgi:hypothetical protein
MSRWIVALVGVWIGLLAASWMFASITFGTAAALAASDARAELREKTSSLSESDRRIVLRFMASEINRTMFRRWLWVQLGVGALLVVMVVRGGGGWMALAVALVVVLVQFGLQPSILAVGHAIDFLPRPLPAELASRFGRLHGAYVLLDFAKMGALLVFTWRQLR